MVRTRPVLVLEHPDRQDAVGLPLVRVGVERRQGEEGIARSPPPPGTAARAGSRPGERREASGLARCVHERPDEPGQAPERPVRSAGRGARPRRPGPAARGGAPRPGRACGRPSPPLRAALRGTSSVRAVGNGADRQRGKPGAPGPGEHVRALHVHGQRALASPTTPPLPPGSSRRRPP